MNLSTNELNLLSSYGKKRSCSSPPFLRQPTTSYLTESNMGVDVGKLKVGEQMDFGTSKKSTLKRVSALHGLCDFKKTCNAKFCVSWTVGGPLIT